MEELGEKGVEDQQIYNIFLTSLLYNINLSDKVVNKKNDGFSKTTITKVLNQLPIKSFCFDPKNRPPQFEDEEEWANYLASRLLLSRVVSSSEADKYWERLGFQIPQERLLTFPNYLPSWFYRNPETLPKREEVEAELENDFCTVEELYPEITSLAAKRGYLTDKLYHKSEKVRDLSESLQLTFNFSRFHYLSQLTTVLSCKEINNERVEEYLDFYIGLYPSARNELSLSGDLTVWLKDIFENHEVNMNAQGIALWLESRLTKLKGVSDINKPFNQELTKMLTEFMCPDSERQIPSNMKSNDPKLYRFLKYEFGPFLSVFSQDRINQFVELWRLSDDLPISEWIWDLSVQSIEAIHNDEMDEVNSLNRKVYLNQIIKFSNSWLAKNWQWLYQETIKKVFEEGDSEVVLQRDCPDSLSEVSEMKKVTEEMEKETEEMERWSGLNGWNVYLTSKPLRPLESCFWNPISTDSKEDFLNGLSEVIHDLGLSVSIKQSSIVNALSSIVEFDDEHERRLDNYETDDGIKLCKLRRGRDRILYLKLNGRERRDLVFYLYHKEADDYRKFER